MNATQQQRILQGVSQAASQLSAAAQALVGGNGGVPTVPSLYLDFLPEELRHRPRDFFTYSPPDFASIAAGATASSSFTTQNDSDFLAVALAGTEVDPAAEQTPLPPEPLVIEIQDGGSGRNWQNRPQAYGNVVGTGQLPAYMPYPKFVDRNSEVTVTIANNDAGGQAYRVRVSILGFKIF